MKPFIEIVRLLLDVLISTFLINLKSIALIGFNAHKTSGR